jgi:uncharacterized protein (TIGR00106 family)
MVKVIADLNIVPMGVGPSVSEYVAKIPAILKKFDLVFEMHANGTNIEGDFMEIARAIEACYATLREAGVPRFFTTLIMGARYDKEQTMQEKLASALSKM